VPSHARGKPTSPARGITNIIYLMLSKIKTHFHSDRVFTFLVIFRWASLIPALLTVNMESEQGQFLSPFWTLGAALVVNLFISIFNRSLNKLVLDYPAALGLDLVFSAGILFVSGGEHSPYFLYALGPLLAGSFFFQMRGAVYSAMFFTPLYLAANQFDLSNGVSLITQLAGVWLIPILFAYPSSLLKTINQARDELSATRDELTRQNESIGAAHRQLKVIHDLTVLLQAAPDLISVQQRVLGAVTTGLGFHRAIVALVDPAREEMGNWSLYPINSSFPSIEPLPLQPENGEIFKALIERKPYHTDMGGDTLVSNTALNSWLKTCRWVVYPLSLREHAVGILMVELDKHEELTRQREDVVTLVANQAALALGTTILCIDRARRLAVETERNRIARDIHDTVAQSLFGITYSLDACVNMLPEHADDVKKELIELRTLASSAHDEVRRSIFDLWPSALTMDIFQADLVNYVNSCCRPRSFSIIFNHSGDFNSLPSGLRRAVYRMAQEALANSARHSGVSLARLSLNVHEGRVDLSVSDEGRGFDPAVALSRSVNREHFGLHGIQERARALDGECEIVSAPGKGSQVTIKIPINGHSHA